MAGRANVSSALSLAARGMHVFPVDHPELQQCAGSHKHCDGQRGKHPVGMWGNISTTDPELIRDRFGGKLRNIGVDCGESDLLVIDEDALDEFARFCKAFGQKVPETYRVETGKGWHFYFRQPDGEPLGNGERVFAGFAINVRGAGGYVVGPGSTHASGAVYRAVEGDVAPCPGWLAEALRTGLSVVELDEGTGDRLWWAEGPIPAGKRHAAIVAAAGWCLSTGMSKAAAVPTIRDVLSRCEGDKYSLDDALARLDDVYWRYLTDEGEAETVEVDEEAFWSARPWLGELRVFARARRVAPWSALGCVLALAVTRIGPQVVLPPLVGGQASLNLLVGLVGESGGGKDTSLAMAKDFLWFDDQSTPTHELNTGEGIDAAYTNATRKGPVQYNDTALFTASEIDSVAAEVDRRGSKLRARLKMVYTGSATGGKTGQMENWRPVGEHQYRLALVAGIQPERARILLDDLAGGTPQRWLWLPTTDPDAPAEKPDEPLPSMWTPDSRWAPQGLDFVDRIERSGRIEVVVCETARADTDQLRYTRLQTGTGGLDTHLNLTRMKVAALFALIDGRLEMTGEDWTLAMLVIDKSTATRSACEQAVTQAARRANKARGEAEGERSVIATEVVEDAAVRRVARVLRRKLDRTWVARRDLRGKITSRDRGYFDPAIDRLVEAGQVESEEAGHGTVYRLAEAAS